MIKDDGTSAIVGTVVAMLILIAVLIATYGIASYQAEADVRRKCERFGVVDLPKAGAMFYCSREPVTK